MTDQTGCVWKSRAAEHHDAKLSFPALPPFTFQVICEVLSACWGNCSKQMAFIQLQGWHENIQMACMLYIINIREVTI